VEQKTGTVIERTITKIMKLVEKNPEIIFKKFKKGKTIEEGNITSELYKKG
jgi:hypothetical protein